MGEHSAHDRLQLGVRQCAGGDFTNGLATFRSLRRAGEDSAQLHCNMAFAYRALGQYEEARVSATRALKRQPDLTPAQICLAAALNGLGRAAESEAAYRVVLAQQPGNPDAHIGLAQTLLQQQRSDEAMATYDAILHRVPDHAEAMAGKAQALHVQGRHAESLAWFEHALARRGAVPEFLYNYGLALLSTRQIGAALQVFEQLRGHRNAPPATYLQYARALQMAGRTQDAFVASQQAMATEPDNAAAMVLAGDILQTQLRRDEALVLYRRAYELNSDMPWLAGLKLGAAMASCDWSDLPNAITSLEADVAAGKRCAYPWDLATLSASASAQFDCASTYAREFVPPVGDPILDASGAHDRIRVAYLSADYHDHATLCLTAGLFEQHDRQRFEIFALSYGPDRDDPMRRRAVRSFEHFLDVRQKADREIAALVRSLGIDILVDLKGYTGDSRPGILAWHAAPVQITYLGYPGTLGLPLADYIIADGRLISAADFVCYGERVILMPDSYQVNDDRRPLPDPAAGPDRQALGLPAQGMVFCAFNSSYKITPRFFAVWMRLLLQVPESVLWLFRSNDSMVGRLRACAAEYGIDPARLVFAPRVSIDDNIARQLRADLFLDTSPCNAHTTASDALRAGLPVITCRGTTFAGRVADSLLHAAGMPDLVTETIEEYETLALRLALDSAALAATRQRLQRNLRTGPLFDTRRFCTYLEAAYVAVLERHRSGLGPAHLDVVSGQWQ